MLTNEVAKQTGVNIETLRFYERKGLLKPPKRLPSGYRKYDDEAVRTVRFIKRAQALGFTLSEISELLRLSAHKQTGCADTQTLGKQKINEIDAKIQDLMTMRGALEQLLGACHEHHTQTCPFLDAVEQEE